MCIYIWEEIFGSARYESYEAGYSNKDKASLALTKHSLIYVIKKIIMY